MLRCRLVPFQSVVIRTEIEHSFRNLFPRDTGNIRVWNKDLSSDHHSKKVYYQTSSADGCASPDSFLSVDFLLTLHPPSSAPGQFVLELYSATPAERLISSPMLTSL